MMPTTTSPRPESIMRAGKIRETRRTGAEQGDKRKPSKMVVDAGGEVDGRDIKLRKCLELT